MDKSLVKYRIVKLSFGIIVIMLLIMAYISIMIQSCSVKKIDIKKDTCTVIIRKIIYDTIIVKQIEKQIEIPKIKSNDKTIKVKLTDRKTGKFIETQILKSKLKLIDTTKFKVTVLWETTSKQRQK